MKDELYLDELCITASSLNYVLSPPRDDLNSIDARMYKSALSTIRRMAGFLSEDNYIFREGALREEKIVEDLFQDYNKFELQKKCSQKRIIDGELITFSATLDVLNKENDCIIEIKNIINYIIPENVNLNDWLNDVYCRQYNTQAQIQMCCYDKFKHHIFLVNSKSFEKIMFSKKWQKEELFIEKNKYMILDYWEMLRKTYDAFIKRDKQTILDLIMHDNDTYNQLLESIMTEEVRLAVDDYVHVYNENMELILRKRQADKERRELDKILDVKKEKIFSAMLESDFKVNEFYKVDGSNSSLKAKIQHQPQRKTYDFERIVRDLGLLHSMSEEDKEKYTILEEEKFSLRVYHINQPLFGQGTYE